MKLSYRRAGSGRPLVCHPGGPGFSASYLGDVGGLGAHAELGVLPIYAVLAVIGAARAFWMPTGQALLPSLVP